MDHIHQHFCLEFEGIIWSQQINPEHTCLVIENRLSDALEAQIHTIDVHEGAFIASSVPETDDWWMGVECVTNDFIFLYGYKNEEDPNHQGVYCLSLTTHELIWKNEDIVFKAIEGDTIIAGNADDEKIYLSASDGKVTECSTEEKPDTHDKLLLPSPFHESNPHYDTLHQFIRTFCEVSPLNVIEYLEFGTFVLISYYLCNESNKLDNYFTILDKEGNIRVQEIIGTELEGIGSDTFYVVGHYIIYIKDKHQLVALSTR